MSVAYGKVVAQSSSASSFVVWYGRVCCSKQYGNSNSFPTSETVTLFPLLPSLKTWLFKSATPSDFFRIETKWGMVKKESIHIE